MAINATDFRTGRRDGFTIVEVLVVVTIIAVLISFLLPALNTVQDQARTVTCMNNLRALGHAWVEFASANNGGVPYADTSGNAWVNSGNAENQYTTGELYPYLATDKVYNCPSAFNENITRSYSVNEIFGSDAPGWGDPLIRNLRQIKNAARCFVFVEEYDPRGYNVNGFCIPKTGSGWVDIPAHRHGGNKGGKWDSTGDSACLNFADGHAEYWKFNDPRTLAISNFFANTPNNPDLIHFQSVVGW